MRLAEQARCQSTTQHQNDSVEQICSRTNTRTVLAVSARFLGQIPLAWLVCQPALQRYLPMKCGRMFKTWGRGSLGARQEQMIVQPKVSYHLTVVTLNGEVLVAPLVLALSAAFTGHPLKCKGGATDVI